MTQVNQKLQNDEAAIHQLIQAAPIAVIVVNDQGEILFANGKLEAIFGYASGELEGQLIEMLVPAAMHKKHIGYRQHYTANPHMRAMGIGLDLMGQHKSGTVFPIEVGLGYLPLGDRLAVMASVLDISPRKQTEAFLEARVRERTQELERRRQVAGVQVVQRRHRVAVAVLHRAAAVLHRRVAAVLRAQDLSGHQKANRAASCCCAGPADREDLRRGGKSRRQW